MTHEHTEVPGIPVLGTVSGWAGILEEGRPAQPPTSALWDPPAVPTHGRQQCRQELRGSGLVEWQSWVQGVGGLST